MPPEGHRGHDRTYRGKVIVHARKHPGAISLCGHEAGWGGSTTRRSEVTCGACLAEIQRRVASRKRSE
jgi:hypothetical protein